jgi:hypothetical protein
MPPLDQKHPQFALGKREEDKINRDRRAQVFIGSRWGLVCRSFVHHALIVPQQRPVRQSPTAFGNPAGGGVSACSRQCPVR